MGRPSRRRREGRGHPRGGAGLHRRAGDGGAGSPPASPRGARGDRAGREGRSPRRPRRHLRLRGRRLQGVAEVRPGERPVERDRPRAGPRRVVERLLGPREDAGGVERVLGVGREADRQLEFQPGRLEPRVEGRDEVLLDRLRRPLRGRLVRLEDEDPEAVALPAADDVHRARRADELRGDLRQEGVPVRDPEPLRGLGEPVHAEVRHGEGVAAPLRAPQLGLEPLEDRPLVVEAGHSVPFGLLLDDLHQPRVVQRDGRRVGQEGEPAPELRGPGVPLHAEREGQDADLLVLEEERHGGGAQAGRDGPAGRGGIEAGDLLLSDEDERLLEPGPHDGVIGVLGRDGACHVPVPFASPVREDPQRLRLGVGVPELRALAREERHRLLAERVLDARAVERRREDAAHLPEAVEEAVRLAFAAKQPGRRHGEGDLDGEGLEGAEQGRAEGPRAAPAETGEDAEDLAARGERDRDEAERPGEVLHGIGCGDEVEPLLVGGHVGQERVGALRGERREEGGGDLLHVPSVRVSRLPGEGRGDLQLVERAKLHDAEVEVEVGADLLHRPLEDRLELGQAPERGVHPVHERDPLGVAPLCVDEPRLLERAGREPRQLLDEAHLLGRQDERAPARHRQEAEDRLALLERDREAPPSARALAVVRVVVVEGGTVRGERANEDAVVLDRASLAGDEPSRGARGRPLPEDVLDLLLPRVVSERLDLVELELALERGRGETDDLVRVQGVESPGGELEEGDGLLAPLHERGDAPLPLEDPPEDLRERADPLVDVDPLAHRQRQGDAEGAAHLLARSHRGADEDEARFDDALLPPFRQEPFEGPAEPLLGGRCDDGGTRPAHRRGYRRNNWSVR